MFSPGDPILIRTVLSGRVRYAQPATVVLDEPDDGLLVWFRPEGTPMKVPAAHLAAGDDRILLSREECLTGQWVHHDADWTLTHVLAFTRMSSWWSAWQMWDAATWKPLCWYVNFECPFIRTHFGFDTRDLCLDLVVFLNGEIVEKDRDDYDERVRTGLIRPDEAAAVDEALAMARQVIAAGSQPFDRRWLDWRPDPAWSVPLVPSGWSLM
jgi:hypothetical protein